MLMQMACTLHSVLIKEASGTRQPAGFCRFGMVLTASHQLARVRDPAGTNRQPAGVDCLLTAEIVRHLIQESKSSADLLRIRTRIRDLPNARSASPRPGGGSRHLPRQSRREPTFNPNSQAQAQAWRRRRRRRHQLGKTK
jgi:hypothetical protein